MYRKLIITLFVAIGFSTIASAENYWVAQYRAGNGNFPKLLELVKTADWVAMEIASPILMRHSQGNHWDLMVLGLQSGACAGENCTKDRQAYEDSIDQLVDFEHSFLARSETSWTSLKKLNNGAGLYHIEMFNAGAGKHSALMRQRTIENDFIERIGQKPNVIFDVIFGADIDIFTIGFYQSLQSYAVPADVTAEQANAAAIAAGFKSRADVSFLLRELIISHHDTLAVSVK